MWLLFTIFDILLFVIVALTVLYLLFFAITATRYQGVDTGIVRKRGRFLFLIAATQDDTEVENTLKSIMKQEYDPKDFDVILVGSNLSPLQAIKYAQYPISLLRMNTDRWSKSEAQKYAIENYQNMKIYDVVIFLNPSDTIAANFLVELNRILQSGIRFMQLHKKPLNLNSSAAILSCTMDEINNSIFRKGHVVCGMPSSLSNSAYVLDYNWYKNNVSLLHGKDGEKSLETQLLKNGVFVDYVEDVCVYTKPFTSSEQIRKQKKGWAESHVASVFSNVKQLLPAVFKRKINLSDKIFQWLMPTRLVLMAIIIIMSLLLPFIYFTMAIKWWAVFLIVTFAFALATPDYIVDRNWSRSFLQAPLVLCSNVYNKFIYIPIVSPIKNLFHKKAHK